MNLLILGVMDQLEVERVANREHSKEIRGVSLLFSSSVLCSYSKSSTCSQLLFYSYTVTISPLASLLCYACTVTIRFSFFQKTAVVYNFFLYVCQSNGPLFAVLFGYKALLQLTTLILAFCTRKVKVKGLNDSKYIAAAIYITSIVLAVNIVSFYTLKDHANVFPAVNGMCYLLGTTMILVLVFVPKVKKKYCSMTLLVMWTKNGKNFNLIEWCHYQK